MPTTPEQDQDYLNAFRAWLALTVPAGPQGPEGPPGPQGPQGPEGPPGSGGGPLPWTCIVPSGGDDAPNINAALAATGSVALQNASYRIDSQIVVPAGATLQGLNRYRTKIIKNFNGDAIRLLSNAELRCLRIEPASDTLDGGCIGIHEGDNYQRVWNVSGYARDYGVKFHAPNAGGLSIWENGSFITWPNTQQYAIQLPTENDSVGSGIRTFRDIVFSGGWGFHVGGAHNTLIERCNMTGLAFNLDPAKMASGVYVLFNRLATGAPIEVLGQNIQWIANSCQYPPTIRLGTNNSTFYPNFGAGFTNNSGDPSVRII